MKQLWLLLICLCSGLLIVSCTKERTPDVRTCNRIVQVFDAFPNGGTAGSPFATIAYDDSGRVRTVIGPGEERRVYKYYPDSIVLKTIYANGTEVADTYVLDGSGRVVRSLAMDYNFRYDDEGYLATFQRHNGKWGQDSRYIPYNLRYANGNLAEVYSSDPEAPLPRITLSYYDLPNQELAGFNSPLWEGRVLADWGMLYLVPGGYFGKASRDLLKAALCRFDDKGRIVSMVDRYEFRYQCP